MTRKTLADDGQILDPLMACYHAAHGYRGGLSVVAHMMGANYNTLQKKLNPTQDFHVLTATEMVHIMKITGDRRVIDALCASADGVFIAHDDVPEVAGDMDLLDAFSGLIASASSVQAHVTRALGDGQITNNEMSQLERFQYELDKAQAVVNTIVEQFKGGE